MNIDKKSRQRRGWLCLTRSEELVALSALVAGLTCCSRGATVSVQGLYPGMGCEKFAEVALPLHENYKKLTAKFNGMKPNGAAYLTKASLIEACQRNDEKGMYLDAATNAGTIFLLQVFGPSTSFELSQQQWLSGLLTGHSETKYVVDGESLSTDLTKKDALAEALKKADAELFADTLSALGPVMIDAKPYQGADHTIQLWHKGDYVVSKDGIGGVRIRPIRKAIEVDLKDSPDVGRIVEALRKDGVKDL